jgi:hypothetical protein
MHGRTESLRRHVVYTRIGESRRERESRVFLDAIVIEVNPFLFFIRPDVLAFLFFRFAFFWPSGSFLLNIENRIDVLCKRKTRD